MYTSFCILMTRGLEVPKVFGWCGLQDEPEALCFFNSLNENEQYCYIKWIYAAKTDQVRVTRIAKALDRLAKKQKYYDKNSDDE